MKNTAIDAKIAVASAELALLAWARTAAPKDPTLRALVERYNAAVDAAYPRAAAVKNTESGRRGGKASARKKKRAA